MTPEKLAKLTPAERERYEMWEAHTEQLRAGGAAVDPRLVGKALMGPAGEVTSGLVKRPKTEPIKDPAGWERTMRAELAPRDAARRPYLSSQRPPLRISRIVTRGKTQAEDVTKHLAACGLAGRPDLVYGLYRVPDRIRPSAGPEGRRVVEWDIVHAATAPLPPADAPADVYFDAEATWVARRIGEPSILDEDLALAYLIAGGHRPGADARRRAPRHDRPARRRQRGLRLAHGRPGARRPRLPPAQRRRKRRGRHGRRRTARPPAGRARRHPRRAHQLGRDRPGRPPRAPAAPAPPVAVPLPAADAPGAAARPPRDRRDRAAGQLRRAGHLRPPARPDAANQHPHGHPAHHRRRRDAVRRRQGPRAHARRRLPGHHLPGLAPPTPRAASAGPRTRRRSSKRTWSARSIRAARCPPATTAAGSSSARSTRSSTSWTSSIPTPRTSPCSTRRATAGRPRFRSGYSTLQ